MNALADLEIDDMTMPLNVPQAPPPARDLEQAQCVSCGRKRPVCCASNFVEQPDGTVFIDPICINCCEHPTGARP